MTTTTSTTKKNASNAKKDFFWLYVYHCNNKCSLFHMVVVMLKPNVTFGGISIFLSRFFFCTSLVYKLSYWHDFFSPFSSYSIYLCPFVPSQRQPENNIIQPVQSSCNFLVTCTLCVCVSLLPVTLCYSIAIDRPKWNATHKLNEEVGGEEKNYPPTMLTLNSIQHITFTKSSPYLFLYPWRAEKKQQ